MIEVTLTLFSNLIIIINKLLIKYYLLINSSSSLSSCSLIFKSLKQKYVFIIDMKARKYDTIKPILKILQNLQLTSRERERERVFFSVFFLIM